MNPARGLPSDCHQRSSFHYIHSHTTQTVLCHSGLHSPCSIALIGLTCSHCRRYGFWAPWTAYSLGPSFQGGGGVWDRARASNLGPDPGPRRSGPSPARVRELNRISSLSPTRDRHFSPFSQIRLYCFSY